MTIIIYSEIDGYDAEEVLDAIRLNLDAGQILTAMDITWHKSGLERLHEWSMTFAPKEEHRA